jgi:hypothetical protein
MTFRLVRPTTAAAVLTLGILLAGCTSMPTAAPTSSAPTTPRPTVTASATPTSSPTSSPTPTAQPAAPASYDLEVTYATCVEYATEGLAGLTGTFTPFDPADTNPISEEKITTDVSDDPNALMMHVTWKSDTSELETYTFCSISGPFDAPVIVMERGSSNT